MMLSRLRLPYLLYEYLQQIRFILFTKFIVIIVNLYNIQHTRLPIDPYFDNDMTSSYMIYRFLPFRNLEVEKIGQNNGIREK